MALDDRDDALGSGAMGSDWRAHHYAADRLSELAQWCDEHAQADPPATPALQSLDVEAVHDAMTEHGGMTGAAARAIVERFGQPAGWAPDREAVVNAIGWAVPMRVPEEYVQAATTAVLSLTTPEAERLPEGYRWEGDSVLRADVGAGCVWATEGGRWTADAVGGPCPRFSTRPEARAALAAHLREKAGGE